MPCICSSTTSQNHTESTYAYTGMMQEFDLDDASTPARKIKGLIKRLNSYKHEPDAPSKLKADSALACKAREMPETINFRAFDTIISRLDSHSEQACYSCNTLYRWTATLLRLYCGFCWDGNFPSATLRTCRFISLTLDMLFRSFIHFVFQTWYFRFSPSSGITTTDRARRKLWHQDGKSYHSSLMTCGPTEMIVDLSTAHM